MYRVGNLVRDKAHKNLYRIIAHNQAQCLYTLQEYESPVAKFCKLFTKYQGARFTLTQSDINQYFTQAIR